MMIRLQNLVFDEKDLFVLLLVSVPFVAHFTGVSLTPFRTDSLVVSAVFILVTRIIIPQYNMTAYLITVCVGLLLSTVISPYSLTIFYAVSLFFSARRTLV